MGSDTRTGSTPVAGTIAIAQDNSPHYRGVEQLVARRAHNPEVGGSSPPPATMAPDGAFFIAGTFTRGVSLKGTGAEPV